jgi:hypothetical protein
MTRRDDLPRDLGRPRRVGLTAGEIAGISVGAGLLALNVAMVAYALATWPS